MSDQPTRKSSSNLHAFNLEGNGSKRPSKRPPEVIETLLEEVVARQAAHGVLLEKLVEDTPTKGELGEVLRETRATRVLLTQHLAEEREERKARALRDEAVMGILGDILGRLPTSGE